MPIIGALTTWNAGNILTDTALEGNFADIRDCVNTYAVLTDVARTITAVQTFSAIPVFSIGATITTGGLTVSAGGVTVTGNSTITGTLTALTGITSSGTAAFAAITASGNLTFSAASAKIIPGATSLLIRDNADANSNIAILDNGNTTIRGTLTVTGGFGTIASATITALTTNGITMGTATTKLLAGATSFTIRDSGDSVAAIAVTGTGVNTSLSLGTGASGSIYMLGKTGVQISDNNYGLLQLGFGGGTKALFQNANGALVLGYDGTNAINANTNFPQIPNVAGTPTGVGGAIATGAMVLDSTNHRLYLYSGGAWKYAALT